MDGVCTDADPISDAGEPLGVSGADEEEPGVLAPVAERPESVVPVGALAALPVAFSASHRSRHLSLSLEVQRRDSVAGD